MEPHHISSPPNQLKEEQEQEQSPPSQPQTTHTHTHTQTCCNCGGPTPLAPPPAWSDTSPPPIYRPIRAPAINLPPNTNTQQAIILAPVPQSQPVPTVSPPYHFQTPTKKIQSQDDLRRFHASVSGNNFLGFVVSLSESIRRHKISDPCHQSPIINSIVSIVETLIQFVEEIPPLPQSARYGNLAYRTWNTRMVENAESFMLRLLPNDLHSAVIELVPYFSDSFGNSSRIDYGTGHETNFAAWLYCLARIGIIKVEDYQAVVSRVFVKYLELMRKLQLVYCLEPAGSHGVWGLDDYHFLPFVFGSSQLIDHKYMKPKSIHNDDILENFSNEYLYLSCIAFVKKVKKGLFAEHSPLLDDISGVPNWNKVNTGMLKMYKVEVLEKVPIMQHFLFGWLIKCEEKEVQQNCGSLASRGSNPSSDEFPKASSLNTPLTPTCSLNSEATYLLEDFLRRDLDCGNPVMAVESRENVSGSSPKENKVVKWENYEVNSTFAPALDAIKVKRPVTFASTVDDVPSKLLDLWYDWC